MKLDQLLYFRETARLEQVGRAAQLLHVTPSAISHSLTALEEELGRPLFARAGRGIRLTDEGRALLERIAPILDQLDALKAELGGAPAAELRGHHRVAAAHLLSTRVLAPICFELQRARPGLTFEVLTERSSQIVEEVLAGQLDLGLCFGPQEHPELAVRVLQEAPHHVVVRSGHPLHSKPRSARIPALSELPAVMPRAAQGVQVCEAHPVFREHGVRLRIEAVVDSYELAAEKLRRSDAWGFFPAWALAQFLGVLTPVALPGSFAPRGTISAIWLKHRPLGRVLLDVLDQAEAQLGATLARRTASRARKAARPRS